MAIPEAIPKIEQNRVSWFDKLTTNGSAPFVLSLSKDAPRPSLNFGTGSGNAYRFTLEEDNY